MGVHLPLFQNVGKQFLNFYFSKLYINLYAEAGTAWDEPLGQLDTEDLTFDIKRDVGVQFSLESYLYYVIPFNIRFGVSWPLDTVNGQQLEPRYQLSFSYE